MIETVLGVLIILYGTVYALFLLRAVWKDRANAAEEPGTFWKVSVCEAVVYFFTTMGVPDFILNTTVFQKCRWVDDRRLPGTLVAAAVFPSALIAFSLSMSWDGRAGHDHNAAVRRSHCGRQPDGKARVMTALSAEVIRKIMAIAMLASMGAWCSNWLYLPARQVPERRWRPGRCALRCRRFLALGFSICLVCL